MSPTNGEVDPPRPIRVVDERVAITLELGNHDVSMSLVLADRISLVPSVRCDFCGSRMVQWRYPAEREWLACAKCYAAIEADDREALLDRASLIPVPRTVSDRYAPRFLERARRLHVEFWETRSGPPGPA